MEVSIRIKTNWPTFILVVIPVGLFCAVVFCAKSLCEAGLKDVLIIAVGMYMLFVLVLLYMLQCGMDIAKKALDLQAELEKRKSEKENRADEDAKYEASAKEQREHELKLAQLTSSLKVEVSDVRLLHA